MTPQQSASAHAQWLFASLGPEYAAMTTEALLLQLSTLCTTDGSPLPTQFEMLKQCATSALVELRGAANKIITPPPGLRVVKS